MSNRLYRDHTFEHAPRFEGELITDAALLSAYATDAGNLVHRMPRAVLKPGSAADVQRLVRFCRSAGLKLAARGQGHTTDGQAQVEAGVIIDMSSLSTIHGIASDRAHVDAGLKWNELVRAAAEQYRTPPVLTGYLGLSIGGTLSVGGVSSSNGGAQVDHVHELEIVTGTGEIVQCSDTHNAELFEAALGGLGQCGIITRASIELVPSKARARQHLLDYSDHEQLFADFFSLLDRGEADDVYCVWQLHELGRWTPVLNVVKFYDEGQTPDFQHLLRGLRTHVSDTRTVDSSYLDYVLRVDRDFASLAAAGLWHDVQHPWFDVFLPDTHVANYVSDVVPTLESEDVGQTGFMLLFALRRSRLKRARLRVPDAKNWVFLFDVLTAAGALGKNAGFASRMRQRNRELFERARTVGGTRYPIGSLDFSHEDWIRHYGATWSDVVRVKQRYDPDGILTPGPSIFATKTPE